MFSFAYTFYPHFSTRTIRKSVAERAGCSKQALLFEENISLIQSGINETITKLSWNFEENRTRDRFYFSNKKNVRNGTDSAKSVEGAIVRVSAWPKWFAWRTNRPQVTRGLTADNEIHCRRRKDNGRKRFFFFAVVAPQGPKCVRREYVLSVSLRFHGFCAWQNRNCQSEYCLDRRDFFFNRKRDMSFSEADRMELDSTYSSSRKWDFLPGSSWSTKIWLEVNGDL